MNRAPHNFNFPSPAHILLYDLCSDQLNRKINPLQQGFFNFLTFIYPRVNERQRLFPDESIAESLYQTSWVGEEMTADKSASIRRATKLRQSMESNGKKLREQMKGRRQGNSQEGGGVSGLSSSFYYDSTFRLGNPSSTVSAGTAAHPQEQATAALASATKDSALPTSPTTTTVSSEVAFSPRHDVPSLSQTGGSQLSSGTPPHGVDGANKCPDDGEAIDATTRTSSSDIDTVLAETTGRYGKDDVPANQTKEYHHQQPRMLSSPNNDNEDSNGFNGSVLRLNMDGTLTTNETSSSHEEEEEN